MARDLRLEAEFRSDLGPVHGELAERPMFGGLCFLHNGNMIGAASDRGALYRVGRQAEPRALALPGAEVMVMGGRPKPGYVRLSGPALADPSTRRALARMALDFTTTLPPKKE